MSEVSNLPFIESLYSFTVYIFSLQTCKNSLSLSRFNVSVLWLESVVEKAYELASES